jgi:hypothetical protein
MLEGEVGAGQGVGEIPAGDGLGRGAEAAQQGGVAQGIRLAGGGVTEAEHELAESGHAERSLDAVGEDGAAQPGAIGEAEGSELATDASGPAGGEGPDGRWWQGRASPVDERVGERARVLGGEVLGRELRELKGRAVVAGERCLGRLEERGVAQRVGEEAEGGLEEVDVILWVEEERAEQLARRARRCATRDRVGKLGLRREVEGGGESFCHGSFNLK